MNRSLILAGKSEQNANDERYQWTLGYGCMPTPELNRLHSSNKTPRTGSKLITICALIGHSLVSQNHTEPAWDNGIKQHDRRSGRPCTAANSCNVSHFSASPSTFGRFYPCAQQ